MQQNLNFGPPTGSQTMAREAGGNDARIIDDEDIARPKHVRQISDRAILESLLGSRAHDEHARRIARRRGPQRNAFGRQIEIEEIDAHETACFSMLRDTRFAGSSA